LTFNASAAVNNSESAFTADSLQVEMLSGLFFLLGWITACAVVASALSICAACLVGR
jgi:hypothetical protein